MATPFTPTEAQKRDILIHVFYEIEQMLLASERKSSEQWLNNALLESTLLHARSLVHFFDDTTRKGKDVLSTDFGFSRCGPCISAADKERLDKELAHLTYARLDRATNEDRTWDYAVLLTPILERARDFAVHITNGPWTIGDPRLTGDCWRLLVGLIDERLARYAQR